MSNRFTRVLSLGLLFGSFASGALHRVHVTERSDVLGGASPGPAGAYERIVGRAFFRIDPKLPANRIISDIDLAPRNEDGLVEFSADVYVLKPRDPAKGNGTVLFEVPNRGRKGMLGMFQVCRSMPDARSREDFGDAFLMERGFTLVWLGWQFDVPRQEGLMRLHAPVAREGDGPIVGLVRADFVPERKVLSHSLADRDHIAYPVLDANDPSSRLTVRDRNDGERKLIPRSQWEFAREESGKKVAVPAHVYMKAGFEPGKIYEVVYRAKDPVLVGLGPAAIRDLISFLKYGGPAGGPTVLDDQRRFVKRAIGYGSSQSGRFLRTFLYYGFNADEKDRKVFDGVWAHVAGAGRGSFNHRFAQASRDAHPHMNFFYPTDVFPFTDLEQTDPESGLSGGILVRAQKAGVVPKVFYTNGSYEYYGRAASLIHTTLDGKQDAPLAKDTRVYLLAGAQHATGVFPPRKTVARNLSNPNDYRWVMRALVVAMQHWLAEGKEPPASRYPRIAAEELAPLTGVRFPRIPGVDFPARIHRAWRVDYGPEFRTRGIVSIEPPRVDKPFPVLLPQVDTDGNETSGIRLPILQVPLGTYTGWNLRDPDLGAPQELYSMLGSFIPFARTKAERAASGDPRLSVEERYGSREGYMKKIEAAARELARLGYLLKGDMGKLLETGEAQWDFVIGTK